MSAILPQPTPHAEVNAVLQQLMPQVQSILGPQFLAMYLYGSLALGDFTLTRSDIDFVVVTATDLPPDLIAALYAMHVDLAAREIPWGGELEGSYIPQHLMRRPDPSAPPYPTIERGETLRPNPHTTGGLIQRTILLEHGITLAGPPPSHWIDPIAPADLRREVRAIAQEWLVPLAADPVALRNSGYQSYTTLTICRILYTLEHGTIVSKPTAARWAQTALGPRWAPLIAWALTDELEETHALIDYALDRVQAYAPPDAP
ncbi:MAG: DUF4111 domain-containing protein [Chloroflexota bacterium]|nr:DUF4111 domain-containing protein [Chloroflexota bacterium]